jgi:hypothetical protein
MGKAGRWGGQAGGKLGKVRVPAPVEKPAAARESFKIQVGEIGGGEEQNGWDMGQQLAIVT